MSEASIKSLGNFTPILRSFLDSSGLSMVDHAQITELLSKAVENLGVNVNDLQLLEVKRGTQVTYAVGFKDMSYETRGELITAQEAAGRDSDRTGTASKLKTRKFDSLEAALASES